jgi:hypothetical protein
MNEKTIAFRPSPRAGDIIASRRSEGCNISAWINGLIENESFGLGRGWQRYFHTIPLPDPGQTPIAQKPLSAVPVGQLNVRYYHEYLRTLHEEGLQLHRFVVDADHSLSVIGVNREEASVEFDKYYTRRSEAEPYVRTSKPLPLIYYDINRHVVYIAEYDQV